MAFTGNQRFELRRELGRGGMGVVFEAWDTERRETIALKMLHRSDSETILRLKQEFRSLSEIAHPNLISMYELLCHEDDWFFTMEFLQGASNFMQDVTLSQRESSEAAGTLPTLDHTTALPSQDSDATRSLSAMPGLTQATVALPDEDATVAHLPFAEKATSLITFSETPTGYALRTISFEKIQQILHGFRQLAIGVQALHAQRKLHRDLKPGNVMVRGDGTVVILDFGLASTRAAKPETRLKPDRAGNQVRQPGSSSSSSDHGISGTIPYMSPEQAAGAPLTEASDWYAVGVMLFEALTGGLPFQGEPIRILRAKQLTEAPEVTSIVSGVPPSLSAVCMGLLQRDSSRRPEGREILQALGATTGPAQAQAIGIDDEPEFVGREQYMQALRAGFDSSRMAPTVVHLHGRSGSGKSTLTENFLERLAAEQPVLVFRGRCYEQESVPYKSVDGIADEIALWLAGADAKDQEALSPIECLPLTKVFPVFRRVRYIAECADRSEGSLALTELRRDAFQALGDLFERLDRRHPLVLWIDDLQWGDVDGVEMLSVALARPGLRVLLLVTYRDEYAATSPSLKALAGLERRAAALTLRDIPVEPLSAEESMELVGAMLRERENEASVEEMQEIIRQADGNPYFLKELAHHIRTGRTLPQSGGSSGTSGLDEILWSRIVALPQAELDLLETIAVSGQPIRLRYAHEASGLEDLPLSILTSLRMHHLVRSSGLSLLDEVETYHDRIRETVLAHLTHVLRRDRHASLAVTLEASGEATSDTLAVHYESGEQPAKAGHFYELAAQESAKALAFARAEAFYVKARKLVPDVVSRTRISERLVHLYTDLARFPEAYATGRAALAELHLKIPAKFHPPSFAVDLFKNWLLLRKIEIESIPDLPVATDPEHIARMTILASIGKAAYQVRPELCIAIMVKMVNQYVLLGSTRDTAIGFMAVGTIFFGGILGRYKTGHRYGKVALQLIDRYDATRKRPEVSFVVGYFGTSWREPATEAEALWRTARTAGLGTGDLFHVGCACAATAISQFMRGAPLNIIAQNTAEDVDLLTRFQLKEPLSSVLAVRRAIALLQDPNAASVPASKQEADFGSRHLAHYAHLLNLQTHYLLGNYEAAKISGKGSAAYIGDSRGMLHGTEHYLYLTLTELALSRRRSPPARILTLLRARRTVRRFKLWARNSPANFASKARLIEAEWLATANRSQQALDRFGDAARTALRYDHPHIAALACQRAASIASEAGLRQHLLGEAIRHYTHWGATGYAATLQQTKTGPPVSAN
ncbi:serine/threonine protein kinase [Granulicella sibirica]|uniref:Serine/threonine protein kinase n=2 Tax=Granulicella sibirica TaxID=2479048 RepID=A0A4Q0T6J4_9BACT|nr:serine/threonine protein kinase [Granulicella sibirica]